jgi:oligopeptide/dipeptide ABC transporter ATP-binding protein
METRGSPLLSVDRLRVDYPSARRGGDVLTAVRDVSIDIAAGEIFALVGESGSGKTSLARALLQLQPATSGLVEFDGDDLAAMTRSQRQRARRHIQAVFQDPQASLSPRRSVLQSLLEPLDHFRIGSRDQRRERVVRALQEVGLDASMQHRYPHELSGGQRQRVALARALVAEPRLIVADEPVSALDVSVRARIVDLIRTLRERRGIAFLFVSHDLSVVRQLADRVAVMYLGSVVETAACERLFNTPAHPYTRALLRAVPVADPRREAPAVLAGEPPSALTAAHGCVFHKRCPEKLECCATAVPAELELASTTQHRVRCHLWNT